MSSRHAVGAQQALQRIRQLARVLAEWRAQFTQRLRQLGILRRREPSVGVELHTRAVHVERGEQLRGVDVELGVINRAVRKQLGRGEMEVDAG